MSGLAIPPRPSGRRREKTRYALAAPGRSPPTISPPVMGTPSPKSRPLTRCLIHDSYVIWNHRSALFGAGTAALESGFWEKRRS
ncbi:hypothetical protein FRUB_08257 [Fimbriiglobus ruber]|uniref:Uncharacterized protein n=1 Tax=Fimbriiglobus ruber TaxID=1908690 RepID=A0A225D7S6_9BACT|nr:hypothetical protein FRUB_08257 [Fimbriiglobus ruber]